MLEAIFNRWRGTGTIFKISSFELIGNIIYALYWFILVSIISFIAGYPGIFAVVIGLFSGILYIAGESFAWGKWIGWITDWEKQAKPDYNNDDGRSFPYIHYIANAFIPQEKHYTRYCILALSIRGLFWWLLFISFLCTVNLLPIFIVPVSLFFLAIGFPIAGYIGNAIHIEFRTKYLNASRGWENQEFVYGFIHFLCITLPLIYFNIF